MKNRVYELYKRITNKLKYGYIKNRVIRQLALRDELYRKLKKEYYPLIENYQPTNYNLKSVPNKIWICWFQGRQNAPELIKKCIDIVERKFKDMEVIVIDDSNFEKYVTFPDYILDKYKDGTISKTHFSDLLRINLLLKHGGLWLDSTVLCTADDHVPSYIVNNPLFVYKEICLDRNDTLPTIASSWLMWAYPNNDILRATNDMISAYWKKEKRLKDYFLLHVFFKIATEKFSDEWNKIPVYNNINPHIMQFELLNKYNELRWNEIIKLSDFHKLNKSIVNTDKKVYTFYDYILKDYFNKN